MKILCASAKKIETAEDIKKCFPICEIATNMIQEQKRQKIQEWLDAGGKENFRFPCPIFMAEITIEGGKEDFEKAFTKTA